jgi:hypothetical protein
MTATRPGNAQILFCRCLSFCLRQSFEAFGRFIETVNPFAVWAQAWLGVFFFPNLGTEQCLLAGIGMEREAGKSCSRISTLQE